MLKRLGNLSTAVENEKCQPDIGGEGKLKCERTAQNYHKTLYYYHETSTLVCPNNCPKVKICLKLTLSDIRVMCNI